MADDIFVMEPPKGPVKQIMGAASEFYGIWKFAKNKEAAIEFLRYYADNWSEAFKASAGYNIPIFANLVPKPMPYLSDDPTSTPHDKLAILQNSDEWSAITGLSGTGHAGDRRNLQQLHHQRHDGEGRDGHNERRRAVKWAAQQCQDHHEEVGAARPDGMTRAAPSCARSGITRSGSERQVGPSGQIRVQARQTPPLGNGRASIPSLKFWEVQWLRY